MTNPYTQVDIENYNLNPPPDDGTETASNLAQWADIKEKLADPLKTALEAMDDNASAAFAALASGGIVSTAISYQVLAADKDKIIVATASGVTITTPSAVTVGSGFKFFVLNNSNGNITLDGSGSQNIDGAANIAIPAGKGVVLDNNGANWFTAGQNWTPSSSIVLPLIGACSDETTALTTGTGKLTFRMPFAFTLTSVRASLTTTQASGNIFTVDINESGTTVLSTKLTIDNGEKTSTTAATPAVISDTSLADDAEITVDIDQIGNGTAKGLKITLIGYKT